MVNACNVDQHCNVQDVEVLDVGLCPRTRLVVKDLKLNKGICKYKYIL